MKKITVFLIAAFSLLAYNGFSQELIPVNFNSKVSNSQLIIEGKVVSKRSFWDNNNYNIYTASKIEVYKVFKGSINTNFIEIITPGGVVGFQKEEVHPSLELESNDVGIFMLHNNTVPTSTINSIPLYQPYASVQGFVKYDLTENKAASVFDKFNNIDQVLYNTITGLTNTNYIVVKPYSVKQTNTSNNKATPTISNFNPTTVTAGTGTQITINGSNFGASAGTVSFSDANDGGSTFYPALATQIISWSNTQIVVEVPSRAGTGPIRVTNTDPASVNSASSLTISYSEINVDFDPGTGTEAYPTQHVDRNATGGYVWQMFTDFDANANEKASFMRAFNSWTSCSGTQINWTIGAVTTTDVIANDNINIIRDDNGSELPVGVLGRCTSRFSGCGGPSIKWYIEELDIVFDDGANWNYGPAAPGFSEYDFETVAVHELGHGHQLGHVISPGAIMHFSVTNGTQNRTPSGNDLAAGNDVMSRSTSTSVCSQGLMTAIACGSAPVADFSGTPTTLCENSTVTFTDLSTNTPTGWSWSFPGGTPSTSTAQNPTITYTNAGTYNVTLTATNAFGNDGETKTTYITVNSCGSAPVADFSGTPTTLCENSTVTFTDLSTNTPTGWSWSFPGGTPSTSTAQNPTITYANAGTYNVTLTATNAFGNDGETKTTYITVNSCGSAPVADFSGTLTTLCENSTVTFTDLSTNTPTGWSWSFPGGTPSTSTAQNPTITYANAGTYNVTLTATNGSGSNMEIKNSYINVTPANGSPLHNTQIRVNDCGITLNSTTKIIYADPVQGASYYQFRVTNSSLGFTYETNWWYSARWIKITDIPGIQPNTTYDVEVRGRNSNCDISSYGAVCQITTPGNIVPDTYINPNHCSSTLTNINTPIYAKSVSGATSYTFEVSNSALGFNRTVTPPNKGRYVNLAWWGSLIQPNTTYDIRVRVTFNNNIGNYSAVCKVTSSSTIRIGEPYTNEEIANMIENEIPLDLIVYPNPNQGDFIYIDLNGLQPNSELFVTDISGKVIQQQQIDTDYENYNGTIRFNEKLNSGFYFVTIVSGEQKITKKLVVR